MKPTAKNPPAAVYHHLDADGRLLYVGCSINPMARFALHRSQSPWATQVVNIKIEWFADQETAFAEEQRQIKELRPPHNRQVNRGPNLWRETYGADLMRAFMAKHDLSVSDFAKAIGTPPALFKRLLEPRAHPRTPRKYAICVATAGEVPTWAFCDRIANKDVSLQAGQAAVTDVAKASEWLRRNGHAVPSPIIASVQA